MNLKYKDINEARRRFYYKDGDVFYKKSLTGTACKDKKVGCVDARGYKRIRFMGSTIAVHQVVFALHNGYIPEVIDHINRDKIDNRIENLRESTHQKNNFNSGAYSHNKSCSYRGVGWHKRIKKWQSSIVFNGKKNTLGLLYGH